MDQAPAKEVTTEAQRKCEGADCNNDAGSLQCPTCQKLGKESYFCSQDCFKRNWVGQFYFFKAKRHIEARAASEIFTLCFQSADSPLSFSCDRPNIKSFTKAQTVRSPTSVSHSPKSSHNLTQMAISTRSPPIPSREALGRSIR